MDESADGASWAEARRLSVAQLGPFDEGGRTRLALASDMNSASPDAETVARLRREAMRSMSRPELADRPVGTAGEALGPRNWPAERRRRYRDHAN